MNAIIDITIHSKRLVDVYNVENAKFYFFGVIRSALPCGIETPTFLLTAECAN